MVGVVDELALHGLVPDKCFLWSEFMKMHPAYNRYTYSSGYFKRLKGRAQLTYQTYLLILTSYRLEQVASLWSISCGQGHPCLK